MAKTKSVDHRVFGATAMFTVSNPRIQYKYEYSLAHISVSSGHGTSQYTSIEAGWLVS